MANITVQQTSRCVYSTYSVGSMTAVVWYADCVDYMKQISLRSCVVVYHDTYGMALTHEQPVWVGVGTELVRAMFVEPIRYRVSPC